MSVNFGGSSSKQKSGGTSTTVVTMPARTATEERLVELQLQNAETQSHQLLEAETKQKEFDASPLAADQRRLEEVATKNLLARATGESPVLSPEQNQYLGTIFGEAQRRGEEGLLSFARDMAAGRGMSLTDTPIASELLRRRADLGLGLEAQRAQSALDLGSANAAFEQNLTAFSEALRQRAVENRLAMAGLQPGFTPFASNLLQERVAQRGQTGTQRGNITGSQLTWGGGASYTGTGKSGIVGPAGRGTYAPS